jgi:tRNA1Val (adenine37-N6)-methyltransferase
MKVGTDGVLLGAWVRQANSSATILDVGTGTGLVALMLAQRFSDSQILGLEIDEEAANQASENVKNSPWANRIEMRKLDFQHLEENSLFDMVVSNPPYFSNSLKNKKIKSTLARHTDSLPPQVLLQKSKKMLTSHGTLSVILPYKEGLHFIELSKKEGFFCNRCTKVYPRQGTDVIRLILEFSLCLQDYQEQELIIENNHRHDYTEDYKLLTKEFYLKM